VFKTRGESGFSHKAIYHLSFASMLCAQHLDYCFAGERELLRSVDYAKASRPEYFSNGEIAEISPY
jgi:hypothetical protein